MKVCSDCGAVIGDEAQHLRWHAEGKVHANFPRIEDAPLQPCGYCGSIAHGAIYHEGG